MGRRRPSLIGPIPLRPSEIGERCHGNLDQWEHRSRAWRRALALWTVLVAQLILAMDFLIVVVALPRIQQDLGFSPAALTRVPNAFGVAFGGLLLLGGRLGDMIG
jgi:hypothetical protein